MKQIIVNILIVALGLSFTDSSAQSLPELINTALQNNYQINIVKNQAEIAANNNVIGNTGQLPSVVLDGAANNSYNSARQVFSDESVREGNNAQNSSINFALLANWTLFDGMRVYAKRDQLAYLDRFGQVNSKFYIEQTVTDIVIAYYQLIYEKELLNNLKQSLSISSYRYKIEKKKREVGSGKTIDYGQALVDFQSDSILYLAQENEIKSLMIEINRVINSDLENEIEIRDDRITIAPMPQKDSLMSLVEANNYQLELKRLQELISESDLRMAKADRYPKIDLFGGYRYSESFSEVGFIQSNRNYGPTFGVTISYNLYKGGAINREIKNSRIVAENQTLGREQVNNDLNADILLLFAQYQSVMDRIALAESNVDAMNNVYTVAAEQLKTGAINGYDFRLTQQSLLRAEVSLLNLKFTLKSIEINLNRLSGRVLSSYL
jgi:outer membrane protein TolC